MESEAKKERYGSNTVQLIRLSFLNSAYTLFVVVRSLYFSIFSTSFLITYLSPEIATSINIHVPFSLLCIKISGFWLGVVLSFCTY